MNVIKYTLNENGTIPDYVIDGGYFAKLNNNNSPQDYDLIGLSESTGIENFINKIDFENYVKSFNDEFTMAGDRKIYIQDMINLIWSRK
jgi:hypothetical protein